MDRFGDIVKRGELHTSQLTLASTWGWSRSKVQRFLDRLEREERIEQETDKRRTKIRLTNYELYQTVSRDVVEAGQEAIQAADKPRTTNRTTINEPVREVIHDSEQAASREPDNEPDNEPGTTERNKQLIKERREGEEENPRVVLKILKSEYASLVCDFGRPCVDWYFTFVTDKLRAKGETRDEAGAYLRSVFILKDQIEKKNWFSPAAEKARSDASRVARGKEQRAQSERRLRDELNANTTTLSAEEARAIINQKFPGLK